MKAGPLNSRVIIKYPSASQDAIGQPVLTWTNFVQSLDGEVWANIKHLNGAESIKADADTSLVKASIRIRRISGVTAAMRVHHGDVVYEIKAVLPDEVGRQHIDLSCERINV
jgi:SPP1 family predicted phage head-tail adaptor